MKRAVISLVLIALAAGCAKPVPPRNCVNAEHKFRLNAPEGWTEFKTAEKKEGVVALKDGVFFLVSPKATDVSEAFVSVRIVGLEEESGAGKLFDKEYSSLKRELEEFKVLERDERFEASGSAAWLATCEFIRDGIMWNGTILFTTSGKRGALMMCACKSNNYPAYKSAFQTICQSFFLE